MSDKLATKIIRKINNARRKAFEKKLPKGKTVDDVINEEVEKLKKYVIFLENCIKFFINTESAIKTKINDIETKTKQDIKQEQLSKEIWILRYAFLYSIFFQIKEPKNEKEITENEKLISYALQNILSKEDKNDYLSWLQEGFNILISHPVNYKNFQSQFTEKVGDKIPLIAFECTGGRLGGESHDSIIELIMTIIEKDKKFFLTGNADTLKEEETENIKNVIEDLRIAREKAAIDFFN